MSNAVRVTPETSAKVANLGLVCALMVVCIHSELPSLPIEALNSLLWLVLKSAVPLFFVFSGFFLSRRFDELGWYARALKSRALSLAVPYLAWLAIGFAAHVAGTVEGSVFAGRGLSAVGSGGCGVRWFGFHPFYAPGIVPLWFLRSLMMLVLCSPLVKFIVNRLGRAWLLFLFVAETLVAYLNCVGTLTETPGWGNFWFYFLSPKAFLFFSVGSFIGSGRASERMRRSLTSWRVLGVMSALVVLPACLCSFGPAVAAPLNQLAICVVMAILWKLAPTRRWPAALVSLSFPIYLAHAVAFEIWWPVRNCLGLKQFPWTNSLALLAVGVGASVASCLLVHRFVPRLSSALFGGR